MNSWTWLCFIFRFDVGVHTCANIWIIHFNNILMRFKLGKCMIYYIIIKLFFNIKLIKNKKLFQLMK